MTYAHRPRQVRVKHTAKCSETRGFVEIFGIRLVGLSAENGHKLLLTLEFFVVFFILRYGLTAIARVIMRGRRNEQSRFWI